MDETSPRHRKPHIGRRLLGRQATVTRASGLRLGRAVAARHAKPEPARAAVRLVPRTGVARSAAPGAPAPAAPAGPAAPAPAPAAAAPAAPAHDWDASPVESTIAPGLSDWAADWLFGDGVPLETAASPSPNSQSAAQSLRPGAIVLSVGDASQSPAGAAGAGAAGAGAPNAAGAAGAAGA